MSHLIKLRSLRDISSNVQLRIITHHPHKHGCMGLCAAGDGSVRFYRSVDAIAAPQVESHHNKIKQRGAAVTRWTVIEDALVTQTKHVNCLCADAFGKRNQHEKKGTNVTHESWWRCGCMWEAFLHYHCFLGVFFTPVPCHRLKGEFTPKSEKLTSPFMCWVVYSFRLSHEELLSFVLVRSALSV